MAYTKQNFEDGQVLTAEHLNKMETELAREKSWNELADKPFGEVLTEIMAETEVVGEYNEDEGKYMASLDASLFSGSGNTKYITFDGVEYTCVADISYGFPCYGNMALVSGTDTGEPFLLVLMPEYGMAGIYVADAEPHTISVYRADVTKLDTIYYDVTAVFFCSSDSSDCYLYTTANCETKATKADVYAAFGKRPILVGLAGETFSTALGVGISDDGTHMVVSIPNPVDGTITTYYTAEYTGE